MACPRRTRGDRPVRANRTGTVWPVADRSWRPCAASRRARCWKSRQPLVPSGSLPPNTGNHNIRAMWETRRAICKRRQFVLVVWCATSRHVLHGRCHRRVLMSGQRGHGQSLSAFWTSSLVMGGDSEAPRNVGTSPSSSICACLKPRRARVDNAHPRLLPCLCASARATASTSSSIVTVVRTDALSHLNIITSTLDDELAWTNATAGNFRAGGRLPVVDQGGKE